MTKQQLSLILTILFIHIQWNYGQWTQYGFDSLHSFQSPYNRDLPITGSCTQWTSSEIWYDARMQDFTFPILQTNDTTRLVYKNVMLDSINGRTLLNWDLDDFGYALAYVPTVKSDVIITLRLSDDLDMTLAAFEIPAMHETERYLIPVWSNSLVLAPYFYSVLDTQHANSMFVAYSGEVFAYDLADGNITWSESVMGNSSSGLLASKGSVITLASFLNEYSITCLNGSNGETKWTRTSQVPLKIHTVVEDYDVLVVSMHTTNSSLSYIVGYSVTDGSVVWSSETYFASIPNALIFKVAQTRTAANCSMSILVTREDGLFTLCVNFENRTAQGMFWSESSPTMDIVTGMHLLSLGDADKNAITTADAEILNEISFYKNEDEVPNRCRLSEHRWTNPIQSRNRKIFVAAEGMERSEFRVISMTTDHCLLLPSCPYFELLSNRAFKAGLIVGVVLTSICGMCCLFCAVLCFKACCTRCNIQCSCVDCSRVLTSCCESLGACLTCCCRRRAYRRSLNSPDEYFGQSAEFDSVPYRIYADGAVFDEFDEDFVIVKRQSAMYS